MYLERYYYDFKDYITNGFVEVEKVDPDVPLVEAEEENDNVEYIKEYPFHDNLDKVPVEEDHYELLIRKFNELFSLVSMKLLIFYQIQIQMVVLDQMNSYLVEYYVQNF